MKTLLSFYIVFSIAITAGTCLVCELCTNDNGDTCTQTNSETCGPSGTRCLSALTLSKRGGIWSTKVQKSCATDSMSCNTAYNMSTGEVEVYRVDKCCQGDHCNKDTTVKLFPVNGKENGLQCPVCAKYEKSCTPTGTIKCQGPQTKCLTSFGNFYDHDKAARVDMAVQGCATENFCKYIQKPHSSSPKFYKLTCTDPKH